MAQSRLGNSRAVVCLAACVVAIALADACVFDSSSSPPETATAPTDPETEVAITRLGDGLWLHTSTRDLPGYGAFVSHGLLVEQQPEGGLLLIDTAWGATATRALLVKIEAEFGRLPSAAIVTDFHDDRAGGVSVLQHEGIAVSSSAGIIERLGETDYGQPSEVLSAPVHGQPFAGIEAEVFSPGPAHSPENLVVWLPAQRVLFGGCMVRSMEDRRLGNLEDADLDAWGPSIRSVRERYPDAELVVPSHGRPGEVELLDRTLALVDIALARRADEAGATPPPTKVAITVDDLPRHGPLPPGTTRADIHRRLTETFERHDISGVRGYLVGQHAMDTEDDREAIRIWLDAGHLLGNHTWSHPNMEEIGVDAYLADVDRNEAVLAELTGDPSGESWRSFRYPFLRQGFDRRSSDRVRAHLDANGYQIAEVSIDFWDWAYQSPFGRCVAAGSDVGLAALRVAYLQRATEMLDWHRAAARDAFGRPIAHVLLLHAGVFTAEMIDELLDAYEARGVVWVGLDEALADPVYRDVPLPAKTHGDVIVEQAIATLGVEHPPWSHHDTALLDALCR